MAGFGVVTSPRSFHFAAVTGLPLDGELERARVWGERLGSTWAAGDDPAVLGAN